MRLIVNSLSDLAQTPFPGQSLEEILASLAATPGEAEFRAGRFRDFTVTSHFQPIVSLSHRRIVGYEGLMRGRNDSGAPVSPLDLLAAAASNFNDLHYLDRLSRIVHMANYTRQDSGSNWLSGGLGNDTFTIQAAASLSGALNGEGGTDTIQGTGLTYALSGANQGSVSGIYWYTIENINDATGTVNLGTGALSGTVTADTVNFGTTGAIAGIVTADTLNYSAWTTSAVTFNMATGNSSGTGGTSGVTHIVGKIGRAHV